MFNPWYFFSWESAVFECVKTTYRSSHPELFFQKGVPRNFAKFTENTCARVSLLMELQVKGRCCTFVPPPLPIVIDDSSWKNAAESFTVALTLTLGGYESAIAPIKCVNWPVPFEAKCLHDLIAVAIPRWWCPDLSFSSGYLIYNVYECTCFKQ